MTNDIESNTFVLPIFRSGNWGHGWSADSTLTGSLAWDLKTRRGLVLDSSAKLSAEASATLSKLALANVKGGIDGQLRLTVGGAFPVDLFDLAGVMAQVSIAAELTGFLQATVRYPLEQLELAMLGKLPAGRSPMLNTFLRHALVRAGLAGRVGASAQVTAQFVAAGTLRDSGRGAGFTFIINLAAGYGWSAGVALVIDVSLDRPDQFLNETVQCLYDAIAQAVADADEEVKESLPYLRMALACAVKACYQTGSVLADRVDADHARILSGQLIIETFVHAATAELLRSLLNNLITEVVPLLPASKLAEKLKNAPEEEVGRIKAELTQVYMALATLQSLTGDNIESNLHLLGDVAGVLIDLTLDLLPQTEADEFADTMATVWAVAALIVNLADWSDEGNLLLPCPDSIGRWMQQKHPGGYPENAWEMAVAQLLYEGHEALRLQQIEASKPGKAFLAWLKDALGLGDQSLSALFSLFSPSPEALKSLLESIANALETVVKAKSTAIAAELEKNNSPVAELYSEVADPLLRSVPLLIPRLTPAGLTGDGAVQTREMVSIALLQTFARTLTVCFDSVIDEACTAGRDSLNAIADSIAQPATLAAREWDSILDAIDAATFGGTPTFDDAADLLRLTSGTLDFFSSDIRENVLPAIYDLLSLGFRSGSRDFEQAWTDLSDSTQVACRPLLEKIWGELAASHAGLAWFAFEQSNLLVWRHFGRMLQVWAKWLEAVAAAVVQFTDDLIANEGHIEEPRDRAQSRLEETKAAVQTELTTMEGDRGKLADQLQAGYKEATWAQLRKKVLADRNVSVMSAAWQALVLEEVTKQFEEQYHSLLTDRGYQAEIDSLASQYINLTKDAVAQFADDKDFATDNLPSLDNLRATVTRECTNPGGPVHYRFQVSLGSQVMPLHLDFNLLADWTDNWTQAPSEYWDICDPLLAARRAFGDPYLTNLSDRLIAQQAAQRMFDSADKVANLADVPSSIDWGARTKKFDDDASVTIEVLGAESSAPGLPVFTQYGHKVQIRMNVVDKACLSSQWGLPARVRILLDHDELFLSSDDWKDTGEMDSFAWTAELQGASQLGVLGVSAGVFHCLSAVVTSGRGQTLTGQVGFIVEEAAK